MSFAALAIKVWFGHLTLLRVGVGDVKLGGVVGINAKIECDMAPKRVKKHAILFLVTF